MTFVTHPEQIRRILRRVGWPITIPEFDPPQEKIYDNICQLLPNTPDGFPEPVQVHYDTGPDPPAIADIDHPHWEDHYDQPYWEE